MDPIPVPTPPEQSELPPAQPPSQPLNHNPIIGYIFISAVCMILFGLATIPVILGLKTSHGANNVSHHMQVPTRTLVPSPTSTQTQQAVDLVALAMQKYDQALTIQNKPTQTPDEKNHIKTLKQDAIALLTQAQTLDQTNYYAWHDAGLVYFNFQDGDPNWYEKAVFALKRAITLNTHQYISYFVLAETYTFGKDYADSVTTYSEVLHHDPPNTFIGYTYFESSVAYKALGDTVHEKEMLTKSLNYLAPSDSSRRDYVNRELQRLQ